MNDPIRDPSNPQYEASFRERLRGMFSGRDMSSVPREELVATIRTMLRADLANASGQPVPKQRMMPMPEALKQVTDQTPWQSSLLAGAKSGADMILGTFGAVSSPFRYGLSKITGDEGIQRTPTVEDIAGKALGMDPSQVRSVTTAQAHTRADQGWKGALAGAPTEFAGAFAPMGLAGKGKTLLETGLRRAGAFGLTEAAQQSEMEGYAPQSAGESAIRLFGQMAGGFSSIAGPAAVRALSSRLPGASAGARISASAAADAASGGVIGAATSPSGQRWEGAIQGAAMNLPGTVLDIPEIRRTAAFQNQFHTRTSGQGLLGATDAVPPEIQARVARLQSVLDTQPNTPETLPTRMKLQEMIDQLLGRGPTDVPPGIVKPTRPFGMTERPIDLPGSTLDEQYRMMPPPPEMQAETLPEPRLTVSEEVDQANALELKRMAEAARQRNQIDPVTPEALGIPDVPPQPELLDIGGTDNPPLGPPRAPEGFTPPTPEAPPQAKPAKLTDLVKQVDEPTLRGMLEPQQLDAVAREYGLTPKQATAIISREFPKDRPTKAAVTAEPQKPVVQEPIPDQPVSADPIASIAAELRSVDDVEALTKDAVIGMMRKYGATRDQFVEAFRQEFDRRTEGPIPRQPKATPEPNSGPVKGNRGLREEPADPRTLGEQQPKEMFSGPLAILPKGVRDALDESLGTQAKAGLKAFSNFPESYRMVKGAFDKLQIRLAEAMPRSLRFISDLFGLPAAQGDVRAFRKWHQNLTENMRLKVAEFGGKLNNLSAADLRSVHYAAEQRAPMRDARLEDVRQALQEVTDAEAAEMIEGGVFPKEVLDRYQREGEQGYVTRIPSQAALKETLSRSIMRGIVDAISGNSSIPEPGTRARIAYDAHLARMASDIEASIHGKLAGRKQISLAEAEKLGYLIGKGPLAATMRQSSKNFVTLRTMRHFKETMRSYWMDAPKMEGGLKPKPPSGWRLADGPEWGALNGKFIKAEAFGDLQRLAQPMKSGWYKLLEAVNRTVKVDRVLGRFGFFIKTQMLLNKMTNNLAGQSIEQSPMWDFKAAKAYGDYVNTGKMHPAIQALIKLDQLGDSHLIQEITEGSDRPQMETSYREIEGVRKEYLKKFLSVFQEELSKRLDIAKTTTISDEGAGGRGAYVMAEAWAAAMDAISGFDPVRATAFNPAKPGRRVIPQFSFDGVKELAVMQDNLFKISLAMSLYESGGGPTGVNSIRKMFGKGQKSRFTAEEAAEVVRDFYDVRQVPPIMRAVAQVPIIGQAFVRWPYIYARNLTAKGYGVRNPLTAMLYTAPVAIFTLAYKSQANVTDEEIEEMRKAAGASPTSAPIYNPFTKETTFTELGDLDTMDQVFRMMNPSLNVRPGPGGKPMRLLRGVMAGNPAGKWAYETVTGNSVYTGTETPAEYKDPFQSVPPLPIPFSEDVRSLVKRDKADKANAKNNQVQMISDEDFYTQLLTGIGGRTVPPKGSQRWYQNIGIANSRAEREALYESGAQAITMPRKPSAPAGPRQPSPPRPPRGP
ncbi:MAG: hypothetical protein IPH13_21015 [Planctomycetes bacterium]|nr:hypothetical protein [Planctomycetota bacterium]